MKGVTPIVATILLLLIVIAIAGFSFLFFLRTTESTTAGGERQLERQTEAIQSNFVIEGVSQNHVYIRNIGNRPLTDLRFYVNNILVSFDGPSSLDSNALGVYNLSNAELEGISNPSSVKVTSIGWEQQIGASPVSGDPPIISDINVSSITSTSAMVTWTTDKVSTSDVDYGTSSGVYTYNATGPGGTSHSVTLNDLLPLITYYFVVRSTDSFGNSAQSSERNFTTLGTILFVGPTPANGQVVSNPLMINMSLNPHVDLHNFTLIINNTKHIIPNLLSCNFENIVGSMINCDDGKNGTMSVPETAPSKFGQSIKVNGSNIDPSNPLTFPSAGNLNSTQGTIMFWIKPNETYQFNSKSYVLLDTGNTTFNSTRKLGFNLSSYNDFIWLCLSTDGPTAVSCNTLDLSIVGGSLFASHLWTFVALAYHRNATHFNITAYYGNDAFYYIIAERTVVLSGSVPVFNSDIYLGSNTSGGRKANATFDNFRVYSTRLTKDDVEDILANETLYYNSNISRRQYGSYYIKLNLSTGNYTISALANRTNDSATLRSETRTFMVGP